MVGHDSGYVTRAVTIKHGACGGGNPVLVHRVACASSNDGGSHCLRLGSTMLRRPRRAIFECLNIPVHLHYQNSKNQ